MAYKKGLLFVLICIVFFTSGCGTFMRSYRMHQVRSYTGDGDIERLDMLMIPFIYGEYGFKVTLPEFTPENKLIRFYKLSEIPKVNAPTKIGLYILLPKSVGEKGPDYYRFIKKTHHVMISITDEESGETVFKKTGQLADFDNGMKTIANGFLLNFLFGEVNFNEISDSSDYMLKMEYQLTGKYLDLPAYMTIICGEESR
jgi:hypothetical protein